MAFLSVVTEVNRFQSRLSPAFLATSARKLPLLSRRQVGRKGCSAAVPEAAEPLVVAVADTMQTSTAETLAQPSAEAATVAALTYCDWAPPAAGTVLPRAAATPGWAV